MKFISSIIVAFYTAWWNLIPRIGLTSDGYFKAWLVVHCTVLGVLVTGNIDTMAGMSVLAAFYVLLSLATTLLRVSINNTLANMFVAKQAEDKNNERIAQCIAKHKKELEDWRDDNPKATDAEWEAEAKKITDRMSNELRSLGVTVTEIGRVKDVTDNNRLH